MAHKRLKQQSFHDSLPDQSRFSTLPVELKLKVLEYFSSEELHSWFSALPIELKQKILEYIPFEELHPGFSALPRELKLQMLEYFSFEDAARTGILSSTSNWSEHPQLILGKRLFEERGRWIAPYAIAWMGKVAEILNNHPKGHIRKFILHIPEMQFNWEPYINNWIAFLSCKGIEVLSLDNWNITTYEISLFLSQCYELTRLKLRNCAYHKSFGSFQKLRHLRLEKIAFGSKIVGAVTISVPSLVWSELVDCTGFQHLNIHAPKLENFIVAGGDGMSRDDAYQMRLRTLLLLGGTTIDEEEEGGLSCDCRCRWREPGYRVKYFFYPGNGRKQFVFSAEGKGQKVRHCSGGCDLTWMDHVWCRLRPSLATPI